MSAWRQLEAYISNLVTNQGQTMFSSIDIAYDLGISGPEASHLIQAYLIAQHQPYAQTLYTIYRTGRTRNAVWHVGARAQDVRAVGYQLRDDLTCRITQAVDPTLQRMGILTPRAAPLIAATVSALNANLQVLAAALP